MNIKEYYDNYNKQNYDVKLNKELKHSKTVKDFYDDCISQNILDRDNVIAWHNMLMKYIDLPDAIFWVRQYENGPRDSITNRFKTRRGCLTRFNDGFSYVFVSNYDAHEIFNMVSKGVLPTAEEFLNMMKNYSFPMHYDNGKSKSCEELDIVAYPNIGNVRGGILTKNSWYLSHINDVNGKYELNGITINLKKNKSEKERIFPRGQLSDWKLENESNINIRNLSYTLTDNEKEIVKAHFLRFVDPLNYFLTPKTSLETNIIYSDKKINIGEEPHLTLYVLNEYAKLYGHQYVDEFIKRALAPAPEVKLDANFVIDVKYGEDIVKNVNNAKLTSAKIVKKTKLSTVNKPKKSIIHLTLSNASLNTKKDILAKTGKIYNTKNEVEELFVNVIFYLNNSGLLNHDDIKMLISEDSKKTFGIGYPAIAYASNYDKVRYLKSSKFRFDGIDYVITKEWFSRDKVLKKVAEWAKTKGIY